MTVPNSMVRSPLSPLHGKSSRYRWRMVVYNFGRNLSPQPVPTFVLHDTVTNSMYVSEEIE